MKPFTNIIATHNPDACKRVVLSCHYDSKYFRDFEFVGATDSAVPCTMILELNNELTLQLMFFDGEEAFKDWTSTDSLYGSRHLASKMMNELRSATACSNNRSMRTELQRIEVLILLDLIGEASPQFCNHFSETKSLFDRLMTTEKLLNRLKLLESKRKSGTRYFPSTCFDSWRVEVPYLLFL
ncbi:hypothetical protein RDWZM_009811 [Blomia tropicalis]|uniref:glutaminyl-peptide cyclotransferase n=1 Tax=Blomia tropicalis TaxID=40697 RepID=A0A9Q0M4C7_BLOTA|nr:hypothetical protein RDWZM_009811 [Blomia tropicalis]